RALVGTGAAAQRGAAAMNPGLDRSLRDAELQADFAVGESLDEDHLQELAAGGRQAREDLEILQGLLGTQERCVRLGPAGGAGKLLCVELHFQPLAPQVLEAGVAGDAACVSSQGRVAAELSGGQIRKEATQRLLDEVLAQSWIAKAEALYGEVDRGRDL